MSDIRDLISATVNEKPADFGNAFQDLLRDKLQMAIANKKIELAQHLVGTPEEELADEEEQESEEETEEETEE